MKKHKPVYTKDRSDLPSTVEVNDRETYELTSRQYTEEGYLEVPARVARTGIQQYFAGEIAPPPGEPDPAGLRERDPREVVNVHRPYDEVFSRESLASYWNKEVTNDHPPKMVSAETYKRYSVGNVTSEGYADGKYVRANLSIKDAAAIADAEAGKKQLSVGYTAMYEYSPGTTEDGEEYEFIQRNIRVNHVALVDAGRAGPGASIFDNEKHQGGIMPTVTIDGKAVGMPDEATAQLVQNALDAGTSEAEKLREDIKDKEEELKEKKEKLQEMEGEKDAALDAKEKAEQAASDEALEQRMKEVSAVRDEARKVAGEKFSCDAVKPLEIKRAALKTVRPNMDWDSKEQPYIDAAWDMYRSQTTQDRAKETQGQFARDMQNRSQNADKSPIHDAKAQHAAFLRGEDPTGGNK